MPYFFVAAAFAAFFLAMGIASLIVLAFRSLRHLLSFAWRIWLWSSLGFVAANALLIAAVRFGILPLLDATTSPPWLRNSVGILGGLTIVLGPFIASAVGVGVGSLLGVVLALRSIRAAKGA
jgi:hypothetical protein